MHGARRHVGAQRLVGQQPLEQAAVLGVVDLAREVLEEAVELVDVAVGDRAGTSAGSAASARSIARTSTCSSSRKRSTRPRTRTSSPRSKRPASRSASRNARAWIAPVRSRSSSARYGAPERAVSRSLREQAKTASTSSPARSVGDRGLGRGEHPRRSWPLGRTARRTGLRYRELDAAAPLGTPSGRPPGARARLRVQGLERRRRGGHLRPHVHGRRARRCALRADRSRRSSSTSSRRARACGSSTACRARSSGRSSSSTRRASRAPRAT